MADALTQFLGWVSPIASTVIVTALTAQIKARQDAAERKRDEAQAETDAKRRAEAEWRERVDGRLDRQDEKIAAVLKGQTTQMRSDLVHRAHRYIDDLGCAGMEEKDAFWAEYEDYCEICKQHGIKNSFVDRLARQVMELPDRPST
jgi:hypothetical protein